MCTPKSEILTDKLSPCCPTPRTAPSYGCDRFLTSMNETFQNPAGRRGPLLTPLPTQNGCQRDSGCFGSNLNPPCAALRKEDLMCRPSYPLFNVSPLAQYKNQDCAVSPQALECPVGINDGSLRASLAGCAGTGASPPALAPPCSIGSRGGSRVNACLENKLRLARRTGRLTSFGSLDGARTEYQDQYSYGCVPVRLQAQLRAIQQCHNKCQSNCR